MQHSHSMVNHNSLLKLLDAFVALLEFEALSQLEYLNQKKGISGMRKTKGDAKKTSPKESVESSNMRKALEGITKEKVNALLRLLYGARKEYV